ncbi:MAG: hypothetical protein ABIU87_12015 [Ornithinibacter sp.]
MVMFEWPDEEDDRTVIVLLRLASEAVDASVARALGPAVAETLGPLDGRRLVEVHILRRLAR